jgi:hypothetical protein
VSIEVSIAELPDSTNPVGGDLFPRADDEQVPDREPCYRDAGLPAVPEHHGVLGGQRRQRPQRRA